MAEYIYIFPRKRKERSSSSDSSVIYSPQETKRIFDLHEEHHAESSSEDEITFALNMTQGVQKSLQDIMKKLEKLDSIEDAVNNLQTSFAKIEARITSLENEHVALKREVEDLKVSLNTNEVDKKETSDNLKDLETKVKDASTELQEENNKLINMIKEVENKNLYLEAYSRRENLKFENIMEFNEREDTESVLREFLQTELGLIDANNIEIQRVHRLGKKKDDQPRPIIARFLRYKDCEKLLSLGHRLKGSAYKMYQDLPREIAVRRKAQIENFKKARRNNIPANFSKSQPDKLYIRGKLWPAGVTFEP